MQRSPFLRAARLSSVALAAVLLGSPCPVLAQKFGQQPYSEPPEEAPPGFGQNEPSLPQAGPGLVGAWSGNRQDQTGVTRVTEYYAPDGSYVAAGQLGNGLTFRGWGRYRASQTGPGQLRVDIQLQGYLPQQLCGQAPGMEASCVPFQLPPSSSALVTFMSPHSFQATSLSTPQSGSIIMARDSNPFLLQRPVPAQALMNVPAPQQQTIQPNGVFGCSPGATRCTNGWLYRCEPVGTNTMWKTGSQRC